MTWAEALEIVVARTGHEQYRRLCADEHPDREMWRQRMVGQATGCPSSQGVVHYPSLIAQAGNALGAAAQFVASGGAMVDQVELGRRLDICRACEHFDPQPERCRVCGCVARWKARLQAEHCPLPVPKW